MLPADADTVLVRGLEFLAINDEGRILVDYQFFPSWSDKLRFCPEGHRDVTALIEDAFSDGERAAHTSLTRSGLIEDPAFLFGRN
jgi:hypothetical protein